MQQCDSCVCSLLLSNKVAMCGRPYTFPKQSAIDARLVVVRSMDMCVFSIHDCFTRRVQHSLDADGCVAFSSSCTKYACMCVFISHVFVPKGTCGICPGPALASLARGEPWILIFMGVYAALALTIAPIEKRVMDAFGKEQ